VRDPNNIISRVVPDKKLVTMLDTPRMNIPSLEYAHILATGDDIPPVPRVNYRGERRGWGFGRN
jgi:hypothetical protein